MRVGISHTYRPLRRHPSWWREVWAWTANEFAARNLKSKRARTRRRRRRLRRT